MIVSVGVQALRRAGYYPRAIRLAKCSCAVSRYNAECALVFIPVYKPLLSALAGVRVRHLFLLYPGSRGKRKNRDEFINYTVRVRFSAFCFSSFIFYPDAGI